MIKTLISHPKLLVVQITGTEGPSHDPYSYCELHVEVPCRPLKDKVTLHEGLGSWVKWNGLTIHDYDDGDRTVRDWFKRYTGYSVEQLERIARKLRSRCAACGGKEFYSSHGYPGESFEICNSCGHVHDYTFNRAAFE
jgi:hypothetical protein